MNLRIGIPAGACVLAGMALAKLTIDEGNQIARTHFAQFACVAPRARQADKLVALPYVQKNSAVACEFFGDAKSWMFETGCPRDLAHTSCLELHPDDSHHNSSHTFGTCAGYAESEAKIRL